MSRSVDAIVLEYHLGLLDSAFIAAEIKQVENCENGWDECDRSKLSPLEESQSAVAEHKRGISACGDGEETCDYSRLTPPEAETLDDAEHKPNYNACITGHGYCDPSPPNGVKIYAIPDEHKHTSSAGVRGSASTHCRPDMNERSLQVWLQRLSHCMIAFWCGA
jgi:hypothetical protein